MANEKLGNYSSTTITDALGYAAVTVGTSGNNYTNTHGDLKDYINAGKSGGKTITGGTGASESLKFLATSDATKGAVEIELGQLLVDYNGTGSVIPWANSTFNNNGGNFKLAINAGGTSNSGINLTRGGANKWQMYNDGSTDTLYIAGQAGGNALSFDSSSNASFTNSVNVGQGSVTTPGLSFGDGDTGFYESADDTLDISIGGVAKWAFTSAIFYATASGGLYLMNETASDTNPVFTFGGDSDTGLGHAGANQLSLIAGGVEGIRVNSASAHSVAGIANYETLVINDDDIPNRKFVMDQVGSADTWDEVMHNGNTFTVLDTENLSATITQNDTTNNPAAFIINNTGSGNDITLPNSSYIKNGTFSMVNLAVSNTVSATNPLVYDADPVLTPGSNQLATMKSLRPSLEPVLDFVDFTTAEPGSPSLGDRYINTVTGTSSGTAQSVTENYIYEWNNVDWTETVPTGGDKVFDNTSGKFYIYTGTAWAVDHASLSQLQFVSGAKAGNDANSATSFDDPVLTLAQMMTVASAKTPASNKIIGIDIIDGGEYTSAASEALPQWCNLSAPNAKLTVSTGAFTLSDDSSCTFGSAEKTGASYLLRKISGTNGSSIHFLGDVDLNSHQFLYLSNSKLNVDFENITTTGADEPVTFAILGTTSVLNTRGKELENTDASANALYAESTAKIYADINRILAPNSYWLYLAGTSTACVRALEATGTAYAAAGAKYDIDILRDENGDHIIEQKSGNIRMTAAADKSIITNRALSTGAMAGLGDRKGFVVSYSSTTAVAISAGWIEANGKLYTLASATTHNMTSLASGYDHHYIYIDDSASSGHTATIIDATTEPSWSDTKQGWYNGDDLCIGSIVSPSGSAIIATFDTLVLSGNVIKYTQTARTNMLQMASNMAPSGSWQTPDDNDGSVVTPVMATAISMQIDAEDAGSICNAYAASSEFAAIETTPANAPFRLKASVSTGEIAEIILGASRNIKIAGASDDDPVLTVYCTGFTIYR